MMNSLEHERAARRIVGADPRREEAVPERRGELGVRQSDRGAGGGIAVVRKEFETTLRLHGGMGARMQGRLRINEPDRAFEPRRGKRTAKGVKGTGLALRSGNQNRHGQPRGLVEERLRR